MKSTKQIIERLQKALNRGFQIFPESFRESREFQEPLFKNFSFYSFIISLSAGGLSLIYNLYNLHEVTTLSLLTHQDSPPLPSIIQPAPSNMSSVFTLPLNYLNQDESGLIGDQTQPCRN